MTNKYGRPKSTNPRVKDLNIRLTTEEYKLIDDCSKQLKTTKTKTVVKAVKDLKEKLDA